MTNKIMALVEEYADAVSSYHLANNPLETGDEYRMDQAGEALATEVQAHIDYTRAVIAERDAALKVAEWNAQAGGFTAEKLCNVEAERDFLKEALQAAIVDRDYYIKERDALKYNVDTWFGRFEEASKELIALRKAAQMALEWFEADLVGAMSRNNAENLMVECRDELRKELGQ